MKRYTLKAYNSETNQITNIQSSDEYHILMEMEDNMIIRNVNDSKEIWICDNLQERMVG